MTIEEFEKFLTVEMTECRKIMRAKNVDYSAGQDKLANFKLASRIEPISAVEALWNMDLKHRTSLLQGVIDYRKGNYRPLSWWNEKIRDHINYMFLLLALLTEEKIKET